MKKRKENVLYYHWRNPNTAVPFTEPKAMTYAAIYSTTTDKDGNEETKISVGVSYCSVDSNFSRKEGRKRALARAKISVKYVNQSKIGAATAEYVGPYTPKEIVSSIKSTLIPLNLGEYAAKKETYLEVRSKSMTYAQ